MNNQNLKKWIIPNLPYILFVYLFDKAAQAVRLAPGADLSGKLLGIFCVAPAELFPGRYADRHCRSYPYPADCLHQRQERKEIP